MKLMTFARKGLLKTAAIGSLATAALVGAVHAAPIDVTAVTTAIDDAETTATTLGGAALGLAVIFMAYRKVRQAIGKV